MRTLRALWNDDRGFILSAELVLIGTLCVLGVIAALTLVRDSVAGEFTDIAGALRSLDQSYYYSGFRSTKGRCGGTKAWTAGSYFSQKGEKHEAQIQSFGDCREVAPAPATQVLTPPCPPVAPQVIPCPPPTVQSVPCAPAPVVCPPTPMYCPTPIEFCPPVQNGPAPVYYQQ